jgi:hypothetical protein
VTTNAASFGGCARARPFVNVRALLVAVIVTTLAVPARADGASFTLETPDVRLEKHQHDAWIPVCESPCSDFVSRGMFRVTGDGLVPTEPFRFAANRDQVIVASMTTRATRTTGIVLTLTGRAIGLFGTSTIFAVGVVVSALGLVLNLPGIMLVVNTSRVTLTF